MTEHAPPPAAPTIRVPSPTVLWVGWLIWLPFFAPTSVIVVHSRTPPLNLAAALLSVAAFAGFYAYATWRNARDLGTLPASRFWNREPARWPFVMVLAALSMLIGVAWHINGSFNLSGFIFTSAYVGGSLRPVRAAITNLALAAICLVLAFLTGVTRPEIVVPLVIMAMVTFVTVSWVGAIVAGHELRAAQGEIARLAASTERLRISRDLHDLLGHQLSLIALKSELSRRLVETDPARAAAEMGEVEALVRTTLQEVRDAVSRYRTPTLAAELHAAGEILAAAGIQFTEDCPPEALRSLPPSHDEALAWVVREGITNVIRHSEAGACSVTLSRDGNEAVLRIVDETSGGQGSRSAAQDPPGEGTGLLGIRERVVALGGRLQASEAGGGFHLSVTLPVPPLGDA